MDVRTGVFIVFEAAASVPGADILLAGYACRLPGAPSVAEFWSVLKERRCTVSEIGEDRWPLGRYFHPRPGEPGKAYTFRAGVIEAPWSFDPSVFGISPREAAQVDPQQRLLLELVWEAFEDAGLPPSRLAGAAVGVFVGASSVDHGTRRVFDPAAGDAYYMTGSALSLIANRISYTFDFTGPSFIIDTACSSSLVALHQAMAALRSGEIDTAVVAGVNMLLSPFPFIGFSSARMLSPEGLCRAFAANGQGYVRSEGGVAIVLAREGAAILDHGDPHARILASGVNSDGRTVGVALPSFEAQGRLLRTVYDRNGIDPDRLAFIEAHGTGTRVGDPIEARAIGEHIGRRRRDPLPIGSAKSNIGHLEPASGLVGLLKATLALRHDLLPATLHAEELNPDIPFDALNLHVAREAVPLARSGGPRCAGISTFGFGGTNAHVVIADPPPRHSPAWIPASLAGLIPDQGAASAPAPPPLAAMLTARSSSALAAGAQRLADVLERGEGDASDVGAALAHCRERLSERAIVIGDLQVGLSALAEGAACDHVVRGEAIAANAPVAFVFCGNGAQWSGMGRVALDNDPIFRHHFSDISASIEARAGWSAIDMLVSADLPDRLRCTSIAQPLLFALQAAAADTLRARGLAPAVVVGHSVGEVAAAYAARLYDREQAVRLILARSSAQEFARGMGKMAVLHVSQEAAQRFIDQIGAAAIEIAAINCPASVTVVGLAGDIASMLRAAAAAGIAGQQLDIDYPFHSRIMDTARDRIIDDLAGLNARPGDAIFMSTVDAAPLDAAAFDGTYWWRNVRLPVLFADAIRRAAAHGAGVFVEIGPRAVLRSYLDQTLRAASATFAVVPTFSREDKPSVDALKVTCATAIARGACFDVARAFGAPPATGWRHLPHYAWQRTHLYTAGTAEALGGVETTLAGAATDGLIGYRTSSDVAVWHSHIDTVVRPELADHCVAGKPWLPAAAFADMALAAAQMWLGHDRVELRDFDISRPLVLSADTTMDVRTSIDAGTATCEIASRPRQSEDAWQVHVRCRVAVLIEGAPLSFVTSSADTITHTVSSAEIYTRAARVGFDYGPAFRRLSGVSMTARGDLQVSFDAASSLWPRASVLSPTDLDGVFHGLFALIGGDEITASGKAFIPVRLGRVQVFRPSVSVVRAVISGVRATAQSLRCTLALFDADDRVVALIEEARFAAAALKADRSTDRVAYHFRGQRHLDVARACSDEADLRALREEMACLPITGPSPNEEAALLLDASAQRAAYDALVEIAGPGGRVDDLDVAGPLAAALAIVRQGELIATDDGESLVNDCPVPPLDQIMPVLLAEHPDFGADGALIADAAQALTRLAKESYTGCRADDGVRIAWTPAAATWQHFCQSAPRARAGACHLEAAIAHLMARWPADRPLRLLQIGADSAVVASSRLAAFAVDGRLQLTIADDDTAVLDQQRTRLAALKVVTCVTLDEKGFAELAQRGPFDAIVASRALCRHDTRKLAALRGCLARDGMLIAIEPDAGPATQLIFSLMAGRGEGAMPVRNAAQWKKTLERAGFSGIDVQARVELAGQFFITCTAENTAARHHDTGGGGPADQGSLPCRVRILAVDPVEAAGFAALFNAACQLRPQPIGATHAEPVADVIILAPADTDNPRAAIAHVVALLKDTLADSDHAPARLWVVAPGGVRHLVGEGHVCSVAAAIWPLVRTIANEYPGIDCRTIDFAEALDPLTHPARLAEFIATPSGESEVVLTAQGYVALRAEQGLAPPVAVVAHDANSGTRLELARPGALQSLHWEVMDRRAPSINEVEIEVAAAGLNFRDVMWAMGMLPAEALEDGFAGATIGFECSGTITRVGAGVTGFSIGDRVFAMAPSALASHVTVASAAVGRISDGTDLKAAATMPVAFLTAHYALAHLGRLRAGEWVLIHGGAGGVGLAAIQIAKARGARIIATAGTREKRALLRLIGADHVFSSRSPDFYDQVRTAVPQGVDVVLNSLAGEMMERSLELVRPFGRFLELGKRDYYENAKIALRPFRRNVSYFGIDVDQIMQHDPRLAQELMAEIGHQMARGELHPLPYRCFDAGEIPAAFRLMQQSGHIGKIIVTPLAPADAVVPPEVRPFTPAADDVHLIAGGLGGFGLATAAWLARCGARTIMLVSRSGATSVDADAQIAALRAEGVDVQVETCDIADGEAVARLIDRVRDAGRRLASVFHCAMVIEDAAIANIDRGAVERVLAPKIDGARHFDRLTRGMGLDHFVLYSSATTLFGNPGQAAYVAANGYLEGLAHERAAAGEHALAVAWGAIGDTGYLARNAHSAALLSARTGVLMISAEDALHHLESVLARGGASPVATIAPVDWQAMTRLLPVLKRPTYAALASADQRVSMDDSNWDLAGEIAGLSAAEAQAVLIGHLTHVIAIIMRTPSASVEAKRPLVEMGVDSLMTVELQVAAKERFGMELPLGALVEGATIEDLAARLLQRLRTGVRIGEPDRDLVAKHMERVDGHAGAIAAQ